VNRDAGMPAGKRTAEFEQRQREPQNVEQGISNVEVKTLGPMLTGSLTAKRELQNSNNGKENRRMSNKEYRMSK
jgi:hypothetical protein